MSEPLVSIVVPIYNAASFLRRTLDSICSQTYRNLEIIAVNDGSTDETPDILETYAARDRRIRPIHQDNQKGAAARNNGIAQATGEYLLVLDADDIFEPELVESMVSRAEIHQADIVVCDNVEYHVATHQTYTGRQQDFLLGAKYLNFDCCCPRSDAPHVFFQIFKWGVTWNKLIRLSFFRQHKLRFLPYPPNDDMNCIFEALILAERVSIVNRPLVCYMVHENNLTLQGNRDIEFPPQVMSILKDCLAQQKEYKALWNSFSYVAIGTLTWNIRNSAKSPDMVLQHISNWAPRFRDILRVPLIAAAPQPEYRFFEATYNPEICLCLPELSPEKQPELLAAVQKLVNAEHDSRLAVRVLYASVGGAPLPTELLEYPVAFPVAVPEGSSAAERLQRCLDFPLPAAPLTLWRGGGAARHPFSKSSANAAWRCWGLALRVSSPLAVPKERLSKPENVLFAAACEV